MKIGIDYSLATATNRGMGRYIREIVNCLMIKDKKNQYILYTHKPINSPLPSNFTEHHIPVSNEIIAEQFFLPKLAYQDNIKVLWCPGNTFPLFLNKNIKLVVTIHDLIFMHPMLGASTIRQKLGRLYRRQVLRLGKNKIDSILTVSQYSATEIEHVLGLNNIKVAYNCISSFYKLAKSIPQPPTRQNFYFTVSGDAPSKNLNFLINIFENHLTSEKLIIAGLPTLSPIRKRQNKRIIFLDAHISDQELILNYKSCKAFIFLSLEEGFGIPVLEAIVCNAPLITSNTTSLPEVVGKCGITVFPKSLEEVNRALQDIQKFEVSEQERSFHLEKFMFWDKSAQIILHEITND